MVVVEEEEAMGDTAKFKTFGLMDCRDAEDQPSKRLSPPFDPGYFVHFGFAAINHCTGTILWTILHCSSIAPPHVVQQVRT